MVLNVKQLLKEIDNVWIIFSYYSTALFMRYNNINVY